MYNNNNDDIFSTTNFRHSDINSISWDTVTKDQKVFNKIKDQIENEINEQVLILQGLIMDLQKQNSKTEVFQPKVYDTIFRISSNIEKTQKSLSELIEKLEYVKDIVDSLKVAYELSDDYQKYKEELNNSIGNIYSSIKASSISNSKTIDQNTISLHTGERVFDSNSVNSHYNDIKINEN